MRLRGKSIWSGANKEKSFGRFMFRVVLSCQRSQCCRIDGGIWDHENAAVT